MDNKKQDKFQFPDPPAYYKNFTKGPGDMQPPSMKALSGMGYKLRFNNQEVHVRSNTHIISL